MPSYAPLPDTIEQTIIPTTNNELTNDRTFIMFLVMVLALIIVFAIYMRR
ncbi:hypothetical protein KAW18_11630 [candidate division WOR-3 bacterium]|nr:hypothetical protein [candidate division WOR-3 bacterium]